MLCETLGDCGPAPERRRAAQKTQTAASFSVLCCRHRAAQAGRRLNGVRPRQRGGAARPLQSWSGLERLAAFASRMLGIFKEDPELRMHAGSLRPAACLLMPGLSLLLLRAAHCSLRRLRLQESQIMHRVNAFRGWKEQRQPQTEPDRAQRPIPLPAHAEVSKN